MGGVATQPHHLCPTKAGTHKQRRATAMPALMTPTSRTTHHLAEAGVVAQAQPATKTLGDETGKSEEQYLCRCSSNSAPRKRQM